MAVQTSLKNFEDVIKEVAGSKMAALDEKKRKEEEKKSSLPSQYQKTINYGAPQINPN